MQLPFSTVRQHGLSLVEMIIVVALFSLMMTVVTSTILTLYKSNSYVIAQSYEIANARSGIEAMVQDIREMTYADDGTFPLSRMEPQLIGFYSDIDNDNSVEYVEYELATTTQLIKRIYNATGTPPVYILTTPDETKTLSEFVQNIAEATSTFYYYDEDGQPQTSSAALVDIRYIAVQAIVNVDPIKNPGEYVMRGSAALRNVIGSI